MKRCIVLMAIMATLAFVGCSKANETHNETSVTPTPEPTVTPTPIPLVDVTSGAIHDAVVSCFTDSRMTEVMGYHDGYKVYDTACVGLNMNQENAKENSQTFLDTIERMKQTCKFEDRYNLVFFTLFVNGNKKCDIAFADYLGPENYVNYYTEPLCYDEVYKNEILALYHGGGGEEGASEEPAVEEAVIETPKPEDLFPVVTYKKIESGKFKKKYVYIDGVVDNVKHNKRYKDVEFNVWFPKGKSYVKDTLWEMDYSVYKESPWIKQLKDGQSVRFCVYVESDSSFGMEDEMAVVKKIKKIASLSDIKSRYKQGCVVRDYNSLMRHPKKWKYSDVKYTGTVFQVIEDYDKRMEFLMELDNGKIVFVYYDRGKKDKRVLENDRVAVYGTFLGIYEYTSVLGSNKRVPKIDAMFVDF